jgi:hypothetical protein
VPVPPGFRQVFPTAMPPRARHLRRVAPTDSLVANDLHGSEDRAKDVSSAGARDTRSISTSGACAFNRGCGQRSLPRQPTGRPMSSVGRPIGEETRYQPTDRPRSPFRRDPAKDHVIPETGTPFTVANARGETKRIAPLRLLRVGLSLTPPTPFPEGEVLSMGLASTVRRSHPRSRLSRDERLWNPLECPRLGLTTQARQRGSGKRGLGEG